MLSRSGDPTKRTRNRLDHLRVRRIGREDEHPVVRVGVAQEETIFLRLAEDVGREIYHLLGHVLDRVFFHHFTELLDRLLRLLRPDHNLLATVATPALDDELVEVLHYVAPVLIYRERPGPGILYEWLLSEVAVHHLGDEGSNALVVYYLRIWSKEHVYFPLDVTLQKTGHLGVERVLVDALVDHIYPAPVRPVDEISIPVHFQVLRLGEDGFHLLGVDVVVEVELVRGTARDDRERRPRPLRGGCAQSGAEAP